MVIHHPTDHRLLQAFPTMPATVIAERVGWTRGKTVFAERVRELRPVYLPPDPAGRTSYLAGEIARVIYGSRTSRCRSATGRSAPPPSCRC